MQKMRSWKYSVMISVSLLTFSMYAQEPSTVSDDVEAILAELILIPEYDGEEGTEADNSRGYLPVPASVNLGSNLSTQILSPTTLGVTTTNLSAAGVYRLTKNSSYTPAATGGSPAIRISGTGVDLDFSHNSFCFSRSISTSTNACFPSATSSSSSSSSTCNTHCVGIEIGYGPNFASGITQPDNVVVENGIMCNWDIAILIHAGVRNVIIRNMVFTDNVIPIIAIGQNNAQGFLEKDISNITLENVSILGANQAQLTCLKWIRMYLSNGAVIPPITLAATGPEGYVNNEVMLLEGNPVEDVYPDYITFGNTNNDVGLGLYVYPGIYFYGVTNVQFNNVSISNIGFDGNLTPGEPSAVAERTAAYGMWFRNCTSIFMQDVDASYTRSGLVAVGAYFDDCEVISIKNGQFTQTGLNLLETAYPTPVFTPEGLWAAGMVLKDSNSLNMSHVVLSHTLGLDSAWGLRTIHSYYTPSVITYPLYSPTIEQYSQNFEFTDVWADSLRGDHVFGYDFGDLYRKVLNTDQFSTGATSNGVIPAGAIHALKMHNVSSCSCLGKLGLTSELLIAKEYKGIYLGDQSSAIRIDGVRIEGNNIASGSTVIGINSGIEFGAVSTVLNNPTTVGQAQGTIFDASFNNVNIARNIGGYQNFEFCGMRAVSTGVIVPQVVGVNTFDTISITNSRFDRNQFEGFRAVDDIDNLAPITIQRLVMNNVSLSNNTDGHGATFQTLLDSDLVKLKCNLNNTVGFSVQTLIDSVSIVESEFNGTTSNAADVIGFDIATAGNCVNFVKTKFGFNSAVDGNATGLHVLAGQSISLKDCSADCNGSTLLNLTGPFTTRGIFFDTSIDNVEFLNVEANNNESGCGNCYGFEIDRATAIYADGMHANNNQAAGVITQNNNVAQVCGIFFKAAVGSAQSEGCYLKDLQACGNFNAYQAFGIHMQSPTGIVMENIDASSNLSDATGQINNLPVLSQAIGLFMEGGNSVSICDLHTNSNQQAEINAVNLSRYLSLGITSADSEANLNLSGFIAHHFPVANLSGAYGTFINGTNDLMIEHGSSGKNEGVRAFGMHARNAVNLFVKDIDASENHGLGTPWFTENPFIGLNPTAVSIPNVQAQCFFGGLDPAAKINLVSTFENLLQGLAQFANQESTSSVGETDNVPAQRVVLGYTLIWSTLAQFRRFCTGVGFGFYESDFPTLEKCRALGNYSEQDSGGGVALYGSAQGALVCDCVTADNRCYDVSERGGEGSFNINGSITDTEWNKFYTFLNVGLLNSQTLVTVNPTCSADQYGFIAIPDTIVTDTNINAPQAKPTQLTQPEQPCNNTDTWVLNSRDVTVGFPGTALPTLLNANTPLYNLVAPAPLGVGILVECQRDAFVGENNSYGNKGNAGCCAGIMSDAGSSTMFLDNKATSNAADVMGFAWGLADMTYSTPNIWYKNWMYANRVDTFMNSSYLITFDTIVSQNQQLPIVVIYPGSTEALSGALPLDNIIVSFVNDRQVYDCLGDDISQTWKCLQFASPLGSTFSDEYYGGPDQFLQIQAQEKRQLDFGGFISNLAGTGTQTQRAAASAAYDYMKDPFRAIPDITHISQGQGYVANDAAWSPASAARYLLVVASGTNALYVYNSSLVLQHTFTAQALFSVAFPSVPAGNALSIDTYQDTLSNTYAVIGFDNGYIMVLDISNATVSNWAPFTHQQTAFQPALGVGVPIDYVRFSQDILNPGQGLVAMSKNGLGSAGVYCVFNTSIYPIASSITWLSYYSSPVTASGPLVDVSWHNASQVGANFAMVLAGTQKILVDNISVSAPVTLDYTGQFENNATCLSFSQDDDGTRLFVGQQNGTMNVINSNGVMPSAWTLVYTTPNLTITNGTTSDFLRVLFQPNPSNFVVTTQNNGIPNNDVIARVYDVGGLPIDYVQMGDATGLPLYDVASMTQAVAWLTVNSLSSLAVAGSNGIVTLQSSPDSLLNLANTDVVSVAVSNNGVTADAVAVNSLSKRLAVSATSPAYGTIWDLSVQPSVLIPVSTAVGTALQAGSNGSKLAWSLDGNYLYAASANGTDLIITVIDVSALPYTVTTTLSVAFTGTLKAVDLVTVNSNDYLAVALNATPFVQIYEFNRSSSTVSNLSGNSFATVLSAATTSANSLAFNSLGTRLFVGLSVSSGSDNIADINVSNPASPILIEYIAAHADQNVTAVAFSSDDATLASYGATDQQIVLTNMANESSPTTLAISPAIGIQTVEKLNFSPDGTRLAAFVTPGSGDTVASTYNLTSLNAQSLLSAYTVDPLVGSTFVDGVWDSFNNLYVAGSTGLAQIDFVNSTAAQAAYQSLNPAQFDIISGLDLAPISCAFSQDGNYIFEVMKNGNALLVYNTQGVVVRTFAAQELLNTVDEVTLACVAAHPFQNMIVVGGADATDGNTTQTLAMVDCSNVDPEQWTIFLGMYQSDVQPTTSGDKISALKFNRSGNKLAMIFTDSYTYQVSLLNIVDPFNPTTWTLSGALQTILGFDGFLDIAWKPDGSIFVVTVVESNSGNINVFDGITLGSATLVPVTTLPNIPSAAAFNFDGSLLAVGGELRGFSVLDSLDSNPLNWVILPVPASFSVIEFPFALLFHPTQNILLNLGGVNLSSVLDLRDGNSNNWTITSLNIFNANAAFGLAWNGTGTIAQIGIFTFDTSSADITQWSIENNVQVDYVIGGFSGMLMNPSGTVLASASTSTEQLTTWDVTNKTSNMISNNSDVGVINSMAWSTDGYYIFTATGSGGSAPYTVALNVFNPTDLTTPVVSSNIISIGNSPQVYSLAVVTLNGVDYLALGLNDTTDNIMILQYDRITGTFTQLFNWLTPGFASLTAPVSSVALNANAAGVVTLLIGDFAGDVGYFTLDFTTLSVTQNWLNSLIHAGIPVYAVAISPDGTVLMSCDIEGLLLVQHNVASGTAVVISTIPDSVLDIVFSHDGQRLAVAGYFTNAAYVYDVSSLYAQVPAVTPTLNNFNVYYQTVAESTLLGNSFGVAWDSQDIDLFLGATYALTGINEINPLTFAIAQDMVNHSDNLQLGANIANSLCSFAQLEQDLSLNITSSDISSAITIMQTYLASNPNNLMGAVRTLQATTLGQALQASTSRSQASLASANRMQSYMSVDLYHPIDAATIALSPAFGWPTELVQSRAADIYLYTQEHLADDPATVAPLSPDPFLQAVATVINNDLSNGSGASVDRGILVLQTAYPQATYPGLAAQVANVGYEYLMTNSDDILGATIAMTTAFVQAGIVDPNNQLCLALGGYMVAYINAAQQLLTYGGMNSVLLRSYSGTAGSPTVADIGSGQGYQEAYRLSTGMYDALRSNPVANQSEALNVLTGAALNDSANYTVANTLQTEIASALSVSTDPNYVDIGSSVPVALTKQLVYSIENNSAGIDSSGAFGGVGGTGGLVLELYSNDLVASTIAAVVVGSGWARESLNGDLSGDFYTGVIDPTAIAVFMVPKLLLGLNNLNVAQTILPSGGYLQALTGSLLNSPSITTYPATTVHSVFATNAFASLGAYLNALADDLLAQGFTTTTTAIPYTGLIAANTNYAALNATAQAAVARAIVLRTLITGNETTARTVFSGVTTSVTIASIVSQIMTGDFTSLYNAANYATGTQAAPSFISTATHALPIEVKQQIAAVAVMFYDTIGAGTGFAGDHVNVMIKSAYNAATSVEGLTADQQAFMAVIGGIGACAAFSQNSALTVPATSTDNASQVGTQLAQALFDGSSFMTAYDIGSTGQDGLSVDLSDQLLTAITSVIVLETCASTEAVAYAPAPATANVAKNIGAYGAPLAYNQIYSDTLMRSVAVLSTQYSTYNGRNLVLNAEPTLSVATAQTIAQSALGQESTSRARSNVAQLFIANTNQTEVEFGFGTPVEQVGFEISDVSWSPDGQYLFAACQNFAVAYDNDGNIVRQFSFGAVEAGQSSNPVISVSARPSGTNTNSYVAYGFNDGSIQLIDISNADPDNWVIATLQLAFIQPLGAFGGSAQWLRFAPDGNHLVVFNSSTFAYSSLATAATITGPSSWTADYPAQIASTGAYDLAWRDAEYFAMAILGTKSIWVDGVGQPKPNNAPIVISALQNNAASVSFSADGTFLIIGEALGTADKINTTSGTVTDWTTVSKAFNASSDVTNSYVRIQLNPASDHAIAVQIPASGDIEVTLYKIANQAPINASVLTFANLQGPIANLSWNQAGTTVAFGGNTEVAFLDSSSGTDSNWVVRTSLREMAPEIMDLSWTPDGQYLLAACGAAGVFVYDVNMKLLTQTIPLTPANLNETGNDAISIATRPGGSNTYAVVGFSSGDVQVIDISAAPLDWVVDTHQQTALQHAALFGANQIDFVRFAPDGYHLVVVSSALKQYALVHTQASISNATSWGTAGAPSFVATAKQTILDIAWRDTSNFAIVEYDSKTILMDMVGATSSQNLLVFAFPSSPTSVSFSTDSAQMAIGQLSGQVSIVDSSSATINTDNWTILDTIMLSGVLTQVTRVLYHPTLHVVVATGAIQSLVTGNNTTSINNTQSLALNSVQLVVNSNQQVPQLQLKRNGLCRSEININPTASINVLNQNNAAIEQVIQELISGSPTNSNNNQPTSVLLITGTFFAVLDLTNEDLSVWKQLGATTFIPNAGTLVAPSFYNSGLDWNPTGSLFSIAGISQSPLSVSDLIYVPWGAALIEVNFTNQAMLNSVINIMQNPAAFVLNPEQIPFFATNIDGLFGHPADLASQLAQFGGLSQAQAAALVNRLYTYLAQTDYFGNEPHQDDTTGAASSVGGCL